MSKKILALIAAGIVCCSAFSGCGNNNGSDSDADSSGNTDSSYENGDSQSGESGNDDSSGSSGDNSDESISPEDQADIDENEQNIMIPINEFLDGVNQDNGQLYDSAFHTEEEIGEAVKLYQSHGYDTYREDYYASLEENTIASAKSSMTRMGCGDNVQFSFEISKISKVASDDLDEYQQTYNDNRGSYLPEATLERVYIVDGIMTAKGDEGEYSGDFQFYVLKDTESHWLLHLYTTPLDFTSY